MDIPEHEQSSANYRYQHLTPNILSSDFSFTEKAPKPGDKVPLFDLPLADGGHIRIEDLIGQQPVLLIPGSLTCPMTASSSPLLKRLHARYGSEVQFITLYVREAHPGESRDQPQTLNEKRRFAQQLAERDQLPWPVAVDDIDGTVHQAFDEKPNATYLTDREGRIVFRALWAGDGHGLSQALEAVALGERPPRSESLRLLVPMARGLGMMHEMMELSGPRAKRDLWRSAPPVAAMAWVADIYRPLPPHWRTAAAAATIVGGLAVAAKLLASDSDREGPGQR